MYGLDVRAAIVEKLTKCGLGEEPRKNATEKTIDNGDVCGQVSEP